jgi:hypothetical protein
MTHIWRMKFPGGAPEQITSGPTGESGVAPAPDGKSFITSVGKPEGTVWFHDQNGDRQISGEGYAAYPMLTEDAKTLFYLQWNMSKQALSAAQHPADVIDLMRADLGTGLKEEVLTMEDVINLGISKMERCSYIPGQVRITGGMCGALQPTIAVRRGRSRHQTRKMITCICCEMAI